MSQMYEILVPCQWNNGKPVRTRHHKEWDKVVRKISGGLTIMKPAKGQWISRENLLYEERMIPVRILCNHAEITKIANFTIKHYRQLAILAYEISRNVIYIEANPEDVKKWAV